MPRKGMSTILNRVVKVHCIKKGLLDQWPTENKQISWEYLIRKCYSHSKKSGKDPSGQCVPDIFKEEQGCLYGQRQSKQEGE